MTISIHQPNFFPWIGYFYKIHLADTFVFLDDVEITKQSYTRRVKIHHQADQSKDVYLSIPLQNQSDHVEIKDIIVSDNEIPRWWDEMLSKIHNTYRHAPFYSETFLFLKDLVAKMLDKILLSEMNRYAIREISEYVGLHTHFLLSSSLSKVDNGEHINHQICEALSVSAYLSGVGAKKYQSTEWYEKNNIDVEYFDIEKTKIVSQFPEDIIYKSIISWLMMYGKDRVASLFQDRN